MFDVCVYIFKCIACSLLVYVCKTERGLDILPTAALQYITQRASKDLAQREVLVRLRLQKAVSERMLYYTELVRWRRGKMTVDVVSVRSKCFGV
jgi:hypothetical protein